MSVHGLVNPLAAEFKLRALSRVAKLKWQRACEFSAPRVCTFRSLLSSGEAVKNWSQPEAMFQEGHRSFSCPSEELHGKWCPPFLLPHSAKPRLAAQSNGTLKALQPSYFRVIGSIHCSSHFHCVVISANVKFVYLPSTKTPE